MRLYDGVSLIGWGFSVKYYQFFHNFLKKIGIIKPMVHAISTFPSNSNQHVTDFLEYYCSFKQAPGYAVLLKGKWGVGKTWFVKKFLEGLSQRNQKYLYVSLYGMASFDDVENEMFKQLHPVLSSKGAVLSGKIFKGLLKTTVKIDLDRDGKDDDSISSQIPDIKIPDYLLKTDRLVIVFDDLERASIPIVPLLGYINHFVEHQQLKVLILANEEEISGYKKKDGTSKVDGAEQLQNVDSYRKIKEKIIGKTFEISPCTSDALSEFIKGIESDEVRDYLLQNTELIHERYEDAKFYNLRHLKQALWDFERLFFLLPQHAKDNSDFIKDLLSLFLIFSFEIKSGELLPSDIELLRAQYWFSLSGKGKPETDSYYRRLSAKYMDFSYFEMVLEPSFWVEFFDKGNVAVDKLENFIEKSKYFRSVSEPDWRRLWRLSALTEEEFAKYLKSVDDDFHSMRFTEVEVIKHVFGMLLELSSIGLYKKSRQELLNFSFGYIDHLKEQRMLRFMLGMKIKAYDNEEWDGLGFTDRDSDEFRELCAHIDKRVDEATIDHYSEAGTEILNYMNSDLESFIQMITYHQDSQNYYYNIPVLNHIDPEVFVRSYLSILPRNKQTVAQAIYRRYSDSGARHYLVGEVEWLAKVIELLRIKAAMLNGSISGYQLERLINYYFSKSLEELMGAT